MDNKAFKQLLLQNASSTNNASSPSATTPRTGSAALGSRLKSSIPMTPRSVSLSASAAHKDFARQVAERRNAAAGSDNSSSNNKKRVRASAPKGSRLGEGYVDRARPDTRLDGEAEDERVERLRALEKAFRAGDLDEAGYEARRAEIAGGDLASTHLVKGLDFRLLERVRKGEDVFGGDDDDDDAKKGAGAEEEEEQEEEDPDEVLEGLAADVKPVEKETARKKGQFAPAELVPGKKRSRNQILAELKAAREAAKAKAAESALGSKFKKIGARPQPGTRIEWDGKGREVMIIVDEDGNERRKVRRVDPKAATTTTQEGAKEGFTPAGEVLGMEVPEFYKKQQAEQLAKQREEEEKEISIFDDAGSDYDPLAGLDGSDADSESEDEGEIEESSADAATTKEVDTGGAAADSKAMPPPPPPQQAPAATRPNYFKDAKTGLISAEAQKRPDLNDPAIQAALRKARALDMQARSEEEVKAAEREAKLKKMLESSSRDEADMDMGFGSSRVEDEADMEDETRVRLSQWGGKEDDDDEGGGGGKAKRKRGGKKRKGDKDSFADVMKVIERRKGGDKA